MPHFERPTITRAVKFALTMLQTSFRLKQYEAQVKKSLAATLVPKFPQIPAEVIPTVVEFWAHAGDY